MQLTDADLSLQLLRLWRHDDNCTRYFGRDALRSPIPLRFFRRGGCRGRVRCRSARPRRARHRRPRPARRRRQQPTSRRQVGLRTDMPGSPADGPAVHDAAERPLRRVRAPTAEPARRPHRAPRRRTTERPPPRCHPARLPRLPGGRVRPVRYGATGTASHTPRRKAGPVPRRGRRLLARGGRCAAQSRGRGGLVRVSSHAPSVLVVLEPPPPTGCPRRTVSGSDRLVKQVAWV